MNGTMYETTPETPRLWDRLRNVRISMPRFRWAGAGDPVPAELRRLALSSPHLLPDLGFERDRTAGNPQLEVWRNGARTVSIRRDCAAHEDRVAVRTTG